jgi:hypothetical protein
VQRLDLLPMTESFRSAVAYRNDLCQSVADLQQRLTRPLPDNATVFVDDTSALYRLAKNLGNTFDALIGRVIVPSDGTGNRWVQESVFGSSPWSGVEVATSFNNIVAAGSNIWAGLGTQAGSFQLSDGDTDMFGVAASSIMTYHGTPRFMMLTSIASVTATDVDLLSTVISKNDDVPAGSSAAEPLKGEQSATIASTGRVCITTQRSLLLAPGDTLRLMLRSSAGDQTIQVQQFSLSVVPR